MITHTSSATVAVTGAGGSLGRALVRRLVRSGHTVKALVRKKEDAAGLRELGATPVLGDVRDAGALETLVRGCQVVFHLAAWMGQPFDEELAFSINVGGTKGVVRAAGAGARRVVLASSIAVYGPVREGLVTEESPIWSVGDLYGDTKIEAERVARREAGRAGVELVILRPTMIYGPGSPSWTERPFASISRGLPVVIGDGEGLADPVYVEDVARAFELAGFHPEAAGETFNVGAGPRTWNAFLGAYAEMAGTRLRQVPAPLARMGAQAGERAFRLLGRRPRIAAQMVGVMTSRAVFSSEKAARILGFEPEFDFEKGMRETEAWLRWAGLLKRPGVALVTGAAGGLGREVARQLAAEGITVWATDLDPGSLRDLKDVRALTLDVTSDSSIAAALKTIEEQSGPVDLLINAAGLAKPGALEGQPFGDVELQFDVNAYGPLRLARAVAPGMRRQGWGRIVNIGSTNGFVVTPFLGAYSASKHALEAISDALRMEMRPWGVEIIVVEPGAMKTAFAEKAKAALREEISNSQDGWCSYLEGFLDGPLWGTANATDPEKVARVVVKAALARRTRARTLATLDAVPSRVMSLLPVAIRDAFFVRVCGLHRPPTDPLDRWREEEQPARQRANQEDEV